jgi:uncharacterized membrane protein YbhN (UPF0104 family)
VRSVWRRRSRILRCAAWQLAAWIAGAGEIWIVVRFARSQISAADALIVESLVQAASSAAFLVPAALGVQEGAFLVLGGAVGLSPETALGLALSRRARDVIVFAPALLAWQAIEGRAIFGGRTSRQAASGSERPGSADTDGDTPRTALER